MRRTDDELPASAAARELGIHYKTLLAWVRDADDLEVAEPRLQPSEIRRTLTKRIYISCAAIERLQLEEL